MSIIKRDCTSFCEFGVLPVEMGKWPLRNEVALGLDY